MLNQQMKICKTKLIFLLFPILLTSISKPCLSQQDNQTASLTGQVSDENTGKPLAFVQVFIQSIQVGDDTDDSGMFAINNLKPGEYQVTVKLVGYKTIHSEVEIKLNEVFRINFQMTAESFHLQDVQITASRHVVLEQDASQLVSVITQAEIRDLNANQTPELLREEIGIYIQKTNNGGGSPIIRGLRANKILLAIDGIRLNNSTYRGGNLQYLNTIDPQSIERIEIVHGPVSALYGSDALGGVINIITKSPIMDAQHKQKWDGFASINSSTADNTHSAHLGLQTANSKWGFLVDASFYSHGNITRGTSGGSTLMDRLRNDSRVSRLLNKTQSPNEYNKFDLMTKIQLSPKESHHFSLAYQLSRQNEVPRYDTIESRINSLWLYDPQERDLVYLNYENTNQNGFFETAKFTLSLNRQFERRIQQRTGSSNQTRDQFETVTYAAQIQMNKILLKKHYFVYGSEIYFDHVNANSSIVDLTSGVETSQDPIYPDGSTYLSFGIFGQAELKLSRRLNFNIGTRFSAFKLKAPFAASGSTADLGTFEISPASLTVSSGVTYSITENVNFVSNIAQGFRAPNLDDASKLGPGKGGSFYDVPNPDVQPERILSFDGGFKIATDIIKINLIGYYSDISDLLLRKQTSFNGLPTIVYDSDTLTVFHKTNVGDAFITGIEFGIEAVLSENLLLKSNLSYTYGENSSFSEPLTAIPPLNGFFAIRRQTSRRWFEINSRFAAAQNRLSSEDHLDLRIPEGGSPGWITFNLRSGFELNEFFNIRFSITNLLDRNYREHMSGFNAPGRNFVLGGEVSL